MLKILIKLDELNYPERARTNYVRLSDWSGKEIYAYTFGGPFQIEGNTIQLLDKDFALAELSYFLIILLNTLNFNQNKIGLGI